MRIRTCTLARSDTAPFIERKPRSSLGSNLGRVDDTLLAVDNVAVEGVLDIRRIVLALVKQFKVGIVFGKEQLRLDIVSAGADARGRRKKDIALAQVVMLRLDQILVVRANGRLLICGFPSPGPSIAEPHMRDNVQGRTFGAPVPGSDAEKKLIRVVVVLGSLDKDIPVAILFKDTCVEDLVFLVFLAALRVLLEQVFVGKWLLRILVEELHVRMLWCVSFDSLASCCVNSYRL